MSSAVALKFPLTASPLSDLVSLHPHQRLAGRYELLKILGSGGCARVYLAIDHQAKLQVASPYVAIKILRAELHNSPQILQAFRQEYRKAQSISHPNLVKAYAFYEESDAVFLVMDALEGRTLGQLFRDYSASGVPKAWSFLMIEQLLAAVQAIHQNNWVHYDLKPGNLFFNKHDSQLKILDLGMAREKTAEGEYESRPMEALTPAYASLEMIEGAPADPRDDIYSMACVIYELLAGKHPFDRLSADQALKANMQPEPIASLTQRQWKVLKHALAFRREDRIASVSAFQRKFFVRLSARAHWRLFFGCAFLTEALFQAWTLWRG